MSEETRKVKTSDELKNAINSVIGNLNAGWPASQDTLLDLFLHFNSNSLDASLIGIFYTKLYKGGHTGIGAAVKNAALKCAAIKFKRDPSDESQYIAFVSKKDKLELASSFAKELAALDKKDGLKSFRPKKASSTGSKKNGNVDNMGAIVFNGLEALRQFPDEEGFVDDAIKTIGALYAQVVNRADKHGLTIGKNNVVHLLKKQVEEEEQSATTNDDDNTDTHESLANVG